MPSELRESIHRAGDHIPTTLILGQVYTVEILVKCELKRIDLGTCDGNHCSALALKAIPGDYLLVVDL